jgi:ubiquinone/menaquinone biosynthesis C-methylase UbiE
MHEYAKENYVTRDPHPSAWRCHANARILQEYGQHLIGDGVDLGCNHGSCTMLIHESSRFPDVLGHVTGVDLNEQALDVARQTCRELNLEHRYSFVQADLRELHRHWQPASLDFAVSFHVLEHIFRDDLHVVLEQVRRVLKPGGVFIVGTPYDRAYPDPCHVSFFKEADMQELVTAHGFETLVIMKDDRWIQKDLLTAVFKKL